MKWTLLFFLAAFAAYGADEVSDLDRAIQKAKAQNQPKPPASETTTAKVAKEESKPEKKEDSWPIYKNGQYPKGRIVKVPELEKLSGQTFSDAWLVGAFKVVECNPRNWGTEIFMCTTSAIPLVKQDGSTIIVLRSPHRVSFRVGDILRPNETTPFKLNKVEVIKGSLVAFTTWNFPP